MTEMPSYLIENPAFEAYKPKNHYPQTVISLFACIFSAFFYISIFYIFNLSPSSIFNSTKMLFIISNTLVLIIASDYGAFICKEKRDLYQKQAVRTLAVCSSVAVPRFPVTNLNEIIPPEVIKKEIVSITCIPENLLRDVGENYIESQKEEQIVTYDARKSDKRRIRKSGKEKKPKSGGIYRRSKSDNTKREMIEEENDEFSSMTNEELNRRVEEFIARFKGSRNR